MRRIVVLAALAAFLALPAVADASPYIRYGVQDDAWLEYGPGTLDGRLDQLDALGVDIVRVTVDWRATEPRPGVYDWVRADALLDGLHSRGIAPLVTLYGSPGWANGGRAPDLQLLPAPRPERHHPRAQRGPPRPVLHQPMTGAA